MISTASAALARAGGCPGCAHVEGAGRPLGSAPYGLAAKRQGLGAAERFFWIPAYHKGITGFYYLVTLREVAGSPPRLRGDMGGLAWRVARYWREARWWSGGLPPLMRSFRARICPPMSPQRGGDPATAPSPRYAGLRLAQDDKIKGVEPPEKRAGDRKGRPYGFERVRRGRAL